jgi:predicted metalloprotease with PDZ domain
MADATPGAATEYRVTVRPRAHVLDVSMELRGVPPGAPLSLATPSWVPGAYAFMRYARDVYDLRATDESGAQLQVTREGLTGFRVEGARSGRVRLTYRAWAYDPAWGELCGLVDDEHAVLLGTRYLFAPALGGRCRVRYELPEGWALHHPGGAETIDARTFEYPSHAALLDAPVVAGNFEVRTRTSGGATFDHLFLDRGHAFDTEVDAFVDQVMKAAEACRAMFGGYPFQRYAFIFSFNPTAHWGLEHAHGTMIGLPQTVLIDPAERARAVRVCAHELFHAWNVCRLKPADLAPPDFTKGSFTESLWIAEGVTRYYEFLYLVRAGILTAEEMISNVVNYYRHLAAMPAFARTSAADSSRATFLNHTRYPGSINNTVDYNDVGMLIAFDLDAAMRMGSPSGSLDAAFRAFYERFAAAPRGYSHQDVLEHFGAAGPGLRDLLRREVETAGGVQVVPTLRALGFEPVQSKVRFAGLVLKENAGPEVANVLDTGPSGESGLAPGDELQLVDGLPFQLKALKWLIEHRDQVAVRVRRGHRTRDFTLTVGERTDLTSLTWNGTEAQLQRLRDWMGRPELGWKAGQAIQLTAFENFHGIQAVI